MKFVEKHPLFGSSVDSSKLALTVKGLLVGITPLVMLIAGVANIDVGADLWAGLIESIVDIITYGGALISSILTLYGLLRKLFKKV